MIGDLRILIEEKPDDGPGEGLHMTMRHPVTGERRPARARLQMQFDGEDTWVDIRLEWGMLKDLQLVVDGARGVEIAPRSYFRHIFDAVRLWWPWR